MFFRKFKKKISDALDDNRYYQTQYQLKMDEVGTSFGNLKEAATDLVKQANGITSLLKRRVELYERRMQVISDNVNDLIIIETINQQWTSVNKFACALLKIDPKKCVGKSNSEIAEIYPQLEKLLTMLTEGEKECWETRAVKRLTTVIEHEGAPIDFEIIISPVETQDHAAHEIIVIGRIIVKKDE